MPRNIERDKREADRRKNQLIEAGFRLFSQNGIETVSLQKVADAANVSPATMYKYFLTKEKLLIAISAKVWDEVWQEALGDPGTNHFEHFTAYQGIEFYADRMIALYKNRPEVLRFSGEYKTYMNRRGNMQPMLRQGRDLFTVAPKGPERCKKYDVVLYRRPSDPYVLHRIIEVRPDSYVILGDNCIAKEYGIRDEDILGVLTSFQHNGHTISVSDWGYEDRAQDENPDRIFS